MADIPKLLPCPFCGGAAQLMGFNAPEFWVCCLKIGCKAGTEAFGSKGQAIAAWNTRAAPPAMEREAVARIVDPNAFKSRQSLYDYCISQGDTEDEARRIADDTHKPDCDKAFAKADAILSTLSADAVRQGEGIEGVVRVAVWNAAKKKGVSDEAALATVEAVIAELPATPASHASDGGKA